MPLVGPVFSLELIRSSRRSRYVWLRVVHGVILLFLLWASYESRLSGVVVSPSAIAEFASSAFWTVGLVQLLATLVLAPVLVAGTIAEERERGTLDELFTTDLSDREIILGKLSARWLQLVGFLAVAVPIQSIIMLLGGVAGEHVLALAAILGVTMVTLTALSIWMSVRARRGRDAVVWVFIATVVFLSLPLLLRMPPWDDWQFSDGLAGVCACLNPLALYVQSWNSGKPEWPSLGAFGGTGVVGSVLLVTLSVFQLRRQHRLQRASKRSWRLGLRPPLRDWPLVWREVFVERPVHDVGFFARFGFRLLWLGVAGSMVAAFLESVGDQAPWSTFRIFSIVTTTLAGCVGLTGVATRAAFTVAGERERQTWDAILVAPVTAGDIVWAKMFGAIYSVRAIWYLLIIQWLLGIVSGQLSLLAVFWVAILVLVLSVFSFTVGFRFSVCCRSSLRAISWTLGLLVFVGGGYLFCCLPVVFAGSDAATVLLATCIPVLLAVPFIISIESLGDGLDMLVVCIAGMALYAIAAGLHYHLILLKFDSWCSRESPSARKPQDATPLAPAATIENH